MDVSGAGRSANQTDEAFNHVEGIVAALQCNHGVASWVEAFGGVSFDPSSVVVSAGPPWAGDVPTISAIENMKR